MSQHYFSNKIVKFIQDNSLIGDYIKTNSDWINLRAKPVNYFSDFKKAVEPTILKGF